MTIAPLAGVSSAAFTPLTALTDTATTRAPQASSSGFGDAVAGALNDLSAVQNHADTLATQAATGQLADVHDYTIAATEATLATELTVAVRNKAIEAFTQIMNLPL
jgi:flagellar hook-basal body complex protein FliE